MMAPDQEKLELDLFAIVWNLASVFVTVVLHSVGTLLVVAGRPRMFRFASRRDRLIRGQLVMTIIVIELLILHLIEIGFWGLCLRALGLFASLGAAPYFAGIAYTSLGWSGALPSPRKGFSEVLIAMIGLLMFGWSVGILVTSVLQYEKALGWNPTSDMPEKGEH
jgi:hypothetical protein